MTTQLTIHWKVLVYVFSFFLLLFSATLIFAQTPEELAKKYGISFPVAELGNCASYSECRTYCEDPVNHTQCIEFAKSKGFYQEEPTQQNPEAILAAAKTELGCDSIASCQSICEQEANFNKCSSFAQKHSLGGGHIEDPVHSRILEKAKEVLGCNSPQSCMSFCEQEANRQKCSDFAQQVGLRGGEHPVGPGGCTSEETCRALCSDPNNYQVCSGFAGSSGRTFTGPGGCNSEESCRAYCQASPGECGYRSPGASPPPGYNPQEMCNKTPNCSWTGNTCQCGLYGETQESQNRVREYADFCKNNPNKCKVGPGGYPIPEDKASQIGVPPGGYQDYHDYCKKYPIECLIYQQGTPTGGYPAEDPASQCARYGCTWTGSSCQCQGATYTSPSPGTYDPASECNKQPGCTWNGTSCQCTSTGGGGPPSPTPYYSPVPGGGTTYDPASECAKVSGCSWTGSSCQCSSLGGTSSTPSPGESYSPQPDSGSYSSPAPTVQGARAVRTFFQAALTYILSLFGK